MGGAVSDHAGVDVAAVSNDSEISRFQYIIFALCILIIMCDGFDTQALAYLAPSIASEWKVSPGSFGPVFAAVLLGSMAGAFAFGYLSDEFGPRASTLRWCFLFRVRHVWAAPPTPIVYFSLFRLFCGIARWVAYP